MVRKPLNGGFSLLSTSVSQHTLPSPPRKPSTALCVPPPLKERVYFLKFAPPGGEGGNPPINYRVHFPPLQPFFFIPFFYHGACRDSKEMIAMQRQSKFPSLRWAGDRQGRRCREKNTSATTGNLELNARWSQVVAPVWLYARRRAGERCVAQVKVTPPQ